MGIHDHAILDAIDEFWRENCYPPTIRDLMQLTDATSTSVVRYVLRKLAAQGLIVRRKARPIPLWVIQAIGGRKETNQMTTLDELIALGNDPEYKRQQKAATAASLQYFKAYQPQPDSPDLDTWPCCPICSEYLDDDGECLSVKDGYANHDPLLSERRQ